MDTTKTDGRFKFLEAHIVTLDDKNRFSVPPTILSVIEKRSELLEKVDCKTNLFSKEDLNKVFFWTTYARNGNPNLEIFDALYHEELLDSYREARSKSIFSAIPVERRIMCSIEESVIGSNRRVTIPKWVIEAGHFKPGPYLFAPANDKEHMTFWPHSF